MAKIAYTEKRPNCQLCHSPSFGAYTATFSTKEELVFLCAECGFSRAWQKWCGGFAGKKLKHLRLEAIFKFPTTTGKEVEAKVLLSDEPDFVSSEYRVTYRFKKVQYVGELSPCNGSSTFPTEWAALERARQISHHIAKEIGKRNHWGIQTGITRVPPMTDESSREEVHE